MIPLVFGNFRLCDACSHGVHIDHKPVQCECDICEPQETP